MEQTILGDLSAGQFFNLSEKKRKTPEYVSGYDIDLKDEKTDQITKMREVFKLTTLQSEYLPLDVKIFNPTYL